MGNRLRNKLASIKEVVREAYENGATLREIAEVHKVSAGTVRNALKEMGVEMRSRGRRKATKDDDPRLLPEVEEFSTTEGHTQRFVDLEDPTPSLQE